MVHVRRGFESKFEREVDPEGVLTPEERSRRAERALRAHMLRLSKKSAEARRARARIATTDQKTRKASAE
jgi:hypothetical protein